jgi:hypothetical protein
VPSWSVVVGAAQGLAPEHLATCARAARERGGARLGGAKGREAAQTGETSLAKERDLLNGRRLRPGERKRALYGVFFYFFSLSGPCLFSFWRKACFFVLVGAGCLGWREWQQVLAPIGFSPYFLCVRNISTGKIRPNRK